ncbi:hypothetical protein MTR_4g036605 [Medicago truncatula]|uniref:Uncharacterized protein n=1 Tax=Medicago truncatula TaxID=3880 RepID=A0A072UI67_MEDTR|nr:hypothetical protein MTR_4g036605 [Medicago truncatula]
MHYLSVNVLKTEPDKGNREREGSFKREFNSNVFKLPNKSSKGSQNRGYAVQERRGEERERKTRRPSGVDYAANG